ncbi:unnamed protein product [Mesocestoides corti]|uniref:Uncharacterized protein n=1 Tax=Mesocestoides corti TaxID=53468 RepID=A0A0R3UEM5_MESCO|nr:unnamed protein product [Mesocestoides corti]
MTSKPNSNNDQLPPDFDRGSQDFNPVTAISRGSPQMQVARKESSSGFMLLSVKHLSKAKRDKNSSVMATNGEKMSPLDEQFDDSCIAKSSSLERDYKGNKQNSFELGRHFSSTASLDAEEYDDDDEEDLGVASEQENLILHQNAAIGIKQCGSSLVHCQPPNLNPCRATHADCVANGHQTMDSVQPVIVSNLHPNQPASIDELRLSSNSQIHAPVAQSIYDLPSQPASEHVYHQPSQPTMFRRLHSEAGSGTSQEPPIPPASHKLPSFLASSQQHSHHPELSAAKHSDPLFDSCAPSSVAAAVTSSMLPSNQQNVCAGFPETATHRFVREFNEEHPRSASDAPIPPTPLSSLNAPVQPASRFRKARIRETVEQWGSNRLSFHDCRLKAVPDWVSYLQTKSVDTSFNHPILQRGRCLYCFVPGSFDLLHLLQAAFTAYHAYALRGYNLSSLLTTWCSGQRASNQALLEHVERLSSNITNHSLKVNASDGPLPPEQIGMASHTAANNSTEVNEGITCSGGEGTSLEGITMVSGSSHHQQTTSADQALASVKSPLKANAGDPEESAAPRVTDPSAAYLRHQLTRSINSGSTGEGVFMDGRIPQPCPPVQQRTDPSIIDQQFVPPTSPAGIGKATDVPHKPGIDGVNVPLLRPFDNAGSTSKPETAIASAPHSPGTELSGPKILHSVEPPSGQSPLSDAVLQGKQNVSGGLTFTQPGELGVPSSLGASDHT